MISELIKNFSAKRLLGQVTAFTAVLCLSASVMGQSNGVLKTENFEWVQLGQTQGVNGLDGWDGAARSVSISGDGTRLAVGMADQDTESRVLDPITGQTLTRTNADGGRASVYQLIDGAWLPMGIAPSGLLSVAGSAAQGVNSIFDGDAEGERFGSFLALSSDGGTLVVMSAIDRRDGFDDFQVFRNGADGWYRVAEDFFDEQFPLQTSQRMPQVSEDGRGILVGGVFFRLESDEGTVPEDWSRVRVTGQVGARLSGDGSLIAATNRDRNKVEVTERFESSTRRLGEGFRVANPQTGLPTAVVQIEISKDGSRVAVSDSGGNLWVYGFDGNQWVALGSPISAPAQFSFSANGDFVAVTRQESSEWAGGVYVYKLTKADADGDGVLNGDDTFPNDPNESVDSDGDGIGDNADTCPGTPVSNPVDASGCTSFFFDTLTVEEQIQLIYIGLLGRAADWTGNDYWVAQAAAGFSPDALRFNIVNFQPEYLDGIGALSRRSLVRALYNNLFARQPDQVGLDYWVSGGGADIPADILVAALVNGAGEVDSATMLRKVEAARYYTEKHLTNDPAQASEAVSQVTGDPNSLTTAIAYIDQTTVSGDIAFEVDAGGGTFPIEYSNSPLAMFVTGNAAINNLNFDIASYVQVPLGGWELDTLTLSPSFQGDNLRNGFSATSPVPKLGCHAIDYRKNQMQLKAKFGPTWTGFDFPTMGVFELTGITPRRIFGNAKIQPPFSPSTENLPSPDLISLNNIRAKITADTAGNFLNPIQPPKVSLTVSGTQLRADGSRVFNVTVALDQPWPEPITLTVGADDGGVFYGWWLADASSDAAALGYFEGQGGGVPYSYADRPRPLKELQFRFPAGLTRITQPIDISATWPVGYENQQIEIKYFLMEIQYADEYRVPVCNPEDQKLTLSPNSGAGGGSSGSTGGTTSGSSTGGSTSSGSSSSGGGSGCRPGEYCPPPIFGGSTSSGGDSSSSSGASTSSSSSSSGSSSSSDTGSTSSGSSSGQGSDNEEVPQPDGLVVIWKFLPSGKWSACGPVQCTLSSYEDYGDALNLVIRDTHDLNNLGASFGACAAIRVLGSSMEPYDYSADTVRDLATSRCFGDNAKAVCGTAASCDTKTLLCQQWLNDALAGNREPAERVRTLCAPKFRNQLP